MKKCWVKVDVHTSYRSHNRKWIKGRLVEYDTFNKMFKVKYKNNGPKVGFFSDENYTLKKPEELKKKWDEATKRAMPYAISFFFVYVFGVTLLFMNDFPDWVKIFCYPLSWIVLISVTNLLHTFFEVEIRQEKILKLLEEKNDN